MNFLVALHYVPCNNYCSFITHTLLLILLLFSSVDAIFLLLVMLHILKSKRLSLPVWASVVNADKHFWATGRPDQSTSDQINPVQNPFLPTVPFRKPDKSSAAQTSSVHPRSAPWIQLSVVVNSVQAQHRSVKPSWVQFMLDSWVSAASGSLLRDVHVHSSHAKKKKSSRSWIL